MIDRLLALNTPLEQTWDFEKDVFFFQVRLLLIHGIEPGSNGGNETLSPNLKTLNRNPFLRV